MSRLNYPAGTQLYHVCQMRMDGKYRFKHWRCSHRPMNRRDSEVFASKMQADWGHVYIVPEAEAGEWGECWYSESK